MAVIEAKPVEKQKRLLKPLGQDWMNPYQRINYSAKLNSRNEEIKRREMTRPTKATTTTTTKATTTTTVNPLCVQVVKIEAPNQHQLPLHFPFTSKDWSPGIGK
jgi:hypothetical protein